MTKSEGYEMMSRGGRGVGRPDRERRGPGAPWDEREESGWWGGGVGVGVQGRGLGGRGEAY